jgi:hypothetical protein
MPSRLHNFDPRQCGQIALPLNEWVPGGKFAMSQNWLQVSYSVAVILGVVALLYWLFFRPHSPPEELPSAIKGQTLGVGGILATVLLLFSSLFSWLVYMSADTIFEQIAALLMWIGNCVFWGIFIVVSAIAYTRK